MFGALGDLLPALAADRPLLLVLDDLHWADTPTMRLFAHLAARPSGPPTLILIAYRETDVEGGHPLTATIADLQRDLPVDRLVLPGLDEEAVARLAEHALGHKSPERVVQALRAQSAGNPFFVEELLRGLDESQLRALPDGGGHVPVGAAQAVARRVNRLGAPAAAVLTAAALIGPEFELRLAADQSLCDHAVKPPPVPRWIPIATWLHSLITRSRRHRSVTSVARSRSPSAPQPARARSTPTRTR